MPAPASGGSQSTREPGAAHGSADGSAGIIGAGGYGQGSDSHLLGKGNHPGIRKVAGWGQRSLGVEKSPCLPGGFFSAWQKAGEERGWKAGYLKKRLQTNQQKGKPATPGLTNTGLLLQV